MSREEYTTMAAWLEPTDLERWEAYSALRARVAALEAALAKAVYAMRAPLDEWKGEVERAALDDANQVLNEGESRND